MTESNCHSNQSPLSSVVANGPPKISQTANVYCKTSGLSRLSLWKEIHFIQIRFSAFPWW